MGLYWGEGDDQYAQVAMKRVAVFRADLLPISETFIQHQVGALRRWEPVLVGFRAVPGGLVTPDVQRKIVPRGGAVPFTLRTVMSRPAARLVAAFSELKVAMVHAHFGTDASDIWPSVRAAGLPMLVTLHGYDINIRRDWWEAGGGGLRRRVYPRRLLQMAGDPLVRFVAVSAAVRQRALEYGIPDNKIAVSHIGVDTERIRPAGLPLEQRRKRVLFVGRMIEKKAPLLLIRAFADVLARVPDAELVMIGDGPLLAGARRLAREMGVPVVFAGACTSEEVLANLHQSRVLCLPSVTAENGDAEGFGLVILEAQACGVPVVTSALGGATEGLLCGRTGSAIAEGAVPQLADRLSGWLSDDDSAMRASLEARQFVVGAFDIRRCTQHLETVYDSLSIATGSA
jgi:glycosyltransferase involved in cell wall biosynthesis